MISSMINSKCEDNKVIEMGLGSPIKNFRLRSGRSFILVKMGDGRASQTYEDKVKPN